MVPGDRVSGFDGQTRGQERTVKEIDDMIGGLTPRISRTANEQQWKQNDTRPHRIFLSEKSQRRKQTRVGCGCHIVTGHELIHHRWIISKHLLEDL